MFETGHVALTIVDSLSIGFLLATALILWRARRRMSLPHTGSHSAAQFTSQMATELWRQQADAALTEIAAAVARQQALLAGPLPPLRQTLAPVERSAAVIPLAAGSGLPGGAGMDSAESRMAHRLARRRQKYLAGGRG